MENTSLFGSDPHPVHAKHSQSAKFSMSQESPMPGQFAKHPHHPCRVARMDWTNPTMINGHESNLAPWSGLLIVSVAKSKSH